MKPFFQHAPGRPFHISVGVVLTNEEGKICVHTWTRENALAEHRSLFEGLDSIYVLMRESLEDNETLLEAAHRGLKEEFGAVGVPARFLGSLQCIAKHPDGDFEKTTLYLEMKVKSMGERPKDDVEGGSTIEWHDPIWLIERMKEQGQKTYREDLDESKILSTYVGR